MNFDTAEYRASGYAVDANAIAAYNAGATGQGIKIGIVDSGINPSLSEFIGRIDPASGDVAGNRGVSDEDGHGTAVSAVAAAARNGSNTLGVAFDATIVSMRADSPGSCADTSPDGGCSFGDGAIAAGIDAARMAGARVINLSLGGSVPGFQLLNSMQAAVNSGIILVISAGNDGETPQGNNPDPFALSPAQNFPGMVIIAGSVGIDTGSGVDVSQISTFSNRAGTGAQSYLAARGLDDRAPDNEGTQFLWSGTSFSAPTISGAVALLAQAFPNLTGAQIAQILFTSADDLGAPGVDSIYGRGRLNIATAMQPIGATSLASSQTAVSTSDNGDLPAAAGDATHGRALGAIILDGYSRAYVLNLAATLRHANQDHPLSRAIQTGFRSGSAAAGPVSVAMTVRERHDLPGGFALERLGIGPDDARRSRLIAGSAIARLDDKTAIAFGFAEGAKAMERRLSGVDSAAFMIARDVAGEPGFLATRNGSVAVRRQFGKTGVTVSGETGNVWQELRTSATGSPYRWTSVAVDRSFGGSWLSAGVSRLEEKQTLLGGRMGAALGGGGSTTMFVDLEARRQFGNGWSAGLSARRGWTDFAAGRFRTGAYGFDLAKTGVLGSGDRLGFRIAQPLRIERGGFAAWLPTGYDYATETATSALTRLSLSPSGRELDGELSYGSRLLGGNAWFGGNLFYRRQPGHIAGADDDMGAAIRFTLGF
ncbi:MAG TPA: S8 family peptidase [Sphingomicrobium sp.]